MINQENYEIWFLDFAEGNLSERQVDLLMNFISQHPELEAEFNDLELIELPVDDSFAFPEKEKLKRPLKADILLTKEDQLLIGELEGDLSAAETKELQQRLRKQPSLQKDQKIYHKTQLSPDLAVKMPDKEALKRRERKVIPLRLIVQIAAAFLLLIVMIFALKKGSVTEAVDMPVVQTDKPIQIEPKTVAPIQQVIESPKIPENMVEESIVEVPKSVAKNKYPVRSKIQPIRVENPVVSPVVDEGMVVQENKNQKRDVPPVQVPKQSPPKPNLEPELPDPKPVIAYKKSVPDTPKTPKASFVGQTQKTSSKRLLALNQPKEIFKKIVKTKIKKVAFTNEAKEQISIPSAIVSAVGQITKKKTSFKKESTQSAKRVSVSIGRLKFSRVKHRSR